MLLGDLLSRFQDETDAAEMLRALGDLALAARVSKAAEAEGLTAGELVLRSVDLFVAQASDEDWLTIVGMMARTDDPGGAFLRHVLSFAFAKNATANKAPR